MVVSLRSKRFQSSYWAKVRAGAKKKVEGGGGGEKRNEIVDSQLGAKRL